KRASAEQSGTVFRVVARNSVDTVHSRSATLTVNAKATVPDEGLSLSGVTLTWTGNGEVQAKPPFGGSNYLSAGVSDGTEDTYHAADGDAQIVYNIDGVQPAPTYAARAAYVGAGEQQVVLSGGLADLKSDGSGTVEWNCSWSVNFYGGLAPFTISDPVL